MSDADRGASVAGSAGEVSAPISAILQCHRLARMSFPCVAVRARP